MRNKREGSVLVVILVIAVTTGLVLGSVSQLAVTEKRTNDRARIIIEAKEAAEAVVETGFAQLVRRFENSTSFPERALSPNGGNPLILTADFYDWFGASKGSAFAHVVLPANPYDPSLAWNTQHTELIAGVIPEGEMKFIDGNVPGNEFDPLRDKLVMVREVRVLGKATVESKVGGFRYTSHVMQNLQVRDAPLFAYAIFYNMDMEIAPGPFMEIRGAVHANGAMYIQSGGGLDFHRNVSATGRIFHGRMPGVNAGGATSDVRFANGLGSLLSMRVGGNWLDSKNTDFRSLASNRWNGNVQSFEHGIQRHNPVAVQSYQPDNPDTTVANDALNFAYQLIQPFKKDPTAEGYDYELERQKFAYKAGLIIEYDDTDQSVVGKIYPRIGTERVDLSGDPVRIDVSEFVSVHPYSASGNAVASGLWDQREQRGMTLVQIDVGELKKRIESANGQKVDWALDKGKDNKATKPLNFWNGVVYVQVPQVADPQRPDGVIPAKKGVAVKLVNGMEIPNPMSAWPAQGTPFEEWRKREIYGMTLATNAPMYIKGHFNADGMSSTGSSTTPDSSNINDEPPAALIADAITILSPDWDNANSKQSINSRTAANFVEISAAILTGLVPSKKLGGSTYSGGVENFPRFLENWSNRTVRYRGSMVCLFESEVSNTPWAGTGSVYNAPRRDWGFNSIFGQGYYPPGTPNSRTYRRVNYRNLSAAEYAKVVEELKAELGL